MKAQEAFGFAPGHPARYRHGASRRFATRTLPASGPPRKPGHRKVAITRATPTGCGAPSAGWPGRRTRPGAKGTRGGVPPARSPCPASRRFATRTRPASGPPRKLGHRKVATTRATPKGYGAPSAGWPGRRRRPGAKGTRGGVPPARSPCPASCRFATRTPPASGPPQRVSPGIDATVSSFPSFRASARESPLRSGPLRGQ